MSDAIEGKSEIKMVMIGGHDITVDKFMNFLDGLKIIPRTHYPHYACNIVIELRKYNDEFYLEFYYNDILKYNKTLQYTIDTLDNSKYSNLYNYCGFPNYTANSLKEKLKKFFRQENDFSLYIILISIIIIIIIIIFLITLIICFAKKRNKFKPFNEEKPKYNQFDKIKNNSISVDSNIN